MKPSALKKKSTPKHPDAHYKVGRQYVVEAEGGKKGPVRFTVAEVLAANDDAEVLKTGKGAYVYVTEKRKEPHYHLFDNLEMIKDRMWPYLHFQDYEELYTQLGGSMDDVEEV